jgi:putative membrane protein
MGFHSILPVGLPSGLVLAAEEGARDARWFLEHLAAAAIFGLVGIFLFLFALWLTVKISPFSLRKELEEDQNVAVGILVGAVFLGIAMIVASAVQG